MELFGKPLKHTEGRDADEKRRVKPDLFVMSTKDGRDLFAEHGVTPEVIETIEAAHGKIIGTGLQQIKDEIIKTGRPATLRIPIGGLEFDSTIVPIKINEGVTPAREGHPAKPYRNVVHGELTHTVSMKMSSIITDEVMPQIQADLAEAFPDKG